MSRIFLHEARRNCRGRREMKAVSRKELLCRNLRLLPRRRYPELFSIALRAEPTCCRSGAASLSPRRLLREPSHGCNVPNHSGGSGRRYVLRAMESDSSGLCGDKPVRYGPSRSMKNRGSRSSIAAQQRSHFPAHQIALTCQFEAADHGPQCPAVQSPPANERPLHQQFRATGPRHLHAQRGDPLAVGIALTAFLQQGR